MLTVRIKKAIGWGALVVALGGAGAGIWRWRAAHAVADISYRTANVEKKKIVAKVTASGTLSATVTVTVGAQVSGRIAKLNADYNSTVRKGELIAKIDPQLFLAAVQKEEANLAANQAGVAKAEAQVRDADLNSKRAQALFDQGLAAQSELQTAQTAVRTSAADLGVAKASLQQEQAALHQAQVNLSYCDIISPIDGTVISRSVDVGQTVASSMTAPVIFTIAEDLKIMQVHTSVAEGDVGRLEPGMETWFTVDAFPGQRFKGTVSQIRNAATTVQNVVTYDAVINVPNDDLRLRPGMTATTTIVYAEKDGALAIPNTAIRFKPPAEVTSAMAASASANPAASLSVTAAGDVPPPAGSARVRGAGGKRPGAESNEKTVYVLRNGHPEAVEMMSGLSDGTITEIASGNLHEGDQVVVEAIIAGKSAPTTGAGAGAPGAPRMGRMF